jgi:hypothetical protein
METFGLELKKNHDLFLSNLMLILNLNNLNTNLENYKSYVKNCDLPTNIVTLLNNFELPKKGQLSDEQYKDELYNLTHEKVQDNLLKLQSTSNNFLNSILAGEMSMDGVSGIIKKVYTAVSTNCEYLNNKSPKLFQLKTLKENNKQVTLTIIPGLDMIYSWYCLNTQDQEKLWYYLDNLFNTSIRMINLVNETNFDNKLLKELNYAKIRTDFVSAFPEQTVINVMNLDIDPFLGVGVNNNSEFGVENMLESTKDLVVQGSQTPGLGSMAKMLGVDKMLNMEELSKQLKNINKSEIDEATKNIKKLLGTNVDENTSEMIGTILNDITDHLKSEDIGSGDPIQNIINIAEKVAKKAIPKIDKNKVDMNKIFESTKNLANTYTDANGNPVLSGNGANPLSMLTSLMNSQMKNMNGGNGNQMSEKDQMKLAQDMMKNLAKQMNNKK